ncbi:MAG: pilin [Proteobacteria bacterium]|nr:pilin [Pseudomonadota bacterium]
MTAINETYQSKGVSDMSCTNAATCGNIGSTFPPTTANVASISSAKNGTITITYQAAILGTSANVLALAPWDGSLATPIAVDLSTPPAAAPAAVVWKCGFQATGSVPATTVAAKFLPSNCR